MTKEPENYKDFDPRTQEVLSEVDAAMELKHNVNGTLTHKVPTINALPLRNPRQRGISTRKKN
jgi:hypothetical protein